MNQGRTLFALALLAALAACSPDKGFRTEEVNRADYGHRWPLTVDTAVLACGPGDVPTVTVDGRSFGLAHVTTPDEAEPGLARIWAEDGQGNDKDVAVLLQDALDLCG